MTAARFMRDISDAIVAVFQASDLAEVARKIESGVLDPIAQQDLLGKDFPYCGVVVLSFSEDSREVTGISINRCDVKCSLAAIHTDEREAIAIVQTMISQIILTVGRELQGNHFSLSDDTGQISDVFVGGGQVTETGVADDETSFYVMGEANFGLEYRLNIS